MKPSKKSENSSKILSGKYSSTVLFIIVLHIVAYSPQIHMGGSLSSVFSAILLEMCISAAFLLWTKRETIQKFFWMQWTKFSLTMFSKKQKKVLGLPEVFLLKIILQNKNITRDILENLFKSLGLPENSRKNAQKILEFLDTKKIYDRGENNIRVRKISSPQVLTQMISRFSEAQEFDIIRHK